MFCISIGSSNLEQVVHTIQRYDLAEIRLDLCGFSEKEIEQLCSKHEGLIFTCRPSKSIPESKRSELLAKAIDSEAAYIDLDIGNDATFLDPLRKKLDASSTTGLITSFHDYYRTPTNKILFDKVIKMAEWRPNLKKIVTTSLGNRDNARILHFNSSFRDTIAFCMGEKGKVTRIACLDYGAPFTYVAEEHRKTAPGQMTRTEMNDWIKELVVGHEK